MRQDDPPSLAVLCCSRLEPHCPYLKIDLLPGEGEDFTLNAPTSVIGKGHRRAEIVRKLRKQRFPLPLLKKSLPWVKALYMDFEEAMHWIEAIFGAIENLAGDLTNNYSLAELGRAIAEDQRLYQEEEESQNLKKEWKEEARLAALGLFWRYA